MPRCFTKARIQVQSCYANAKMSRKNLVVSFSYPAYPSLSLSPVSARMSRAPREGPSAVKPSLRRRRPCCRKRESGNCHLLTTFAETVVLPFGTPADGEGLSR